MVLIYRSSARSALRQLGSGPAFASSSRSVAAASFSTTSTSYAAPNSEEATARKPPFTADAEADPPSFEENAIGRARESERDVRPGTLPPFQHWIQDQALMYKKPMPGLGPNWIGRTPYPLNPAFNPPPPIHSRTKHDIWRRHTNDPEKGTIRSLSEQYSIGLQRMEAILRLKALEAEWTSRNQPLQTEFQKHMDRLLGAQDRTRAPEPEPSVRSKESSVRGLQHEEFSDATPLDEPSVLAPALAEESMKRASMIAALPSGGPDMDADMSNKIIQTKRAPIAITNVSGDSYTGAGRIERTHRRAEKRRAYRAKRRTERAAFCAERSAYYAERAAEEKKGERAAFFTQLSTRFAERSARFAERAAQSQAAEQFDAKPAEAKISGKKVPGKRAPSKKATGNKASGKK